MCFSCICLFILQTSISVIFLFLLVSGIDCGLWLWHSLDFSISIFTVCFVSLLDRNNKPNKNQKWFPLRAMKTFIRKKMGHTYKKCRSVVQSGLVGWGEGEGGRGHSDISWVIMCVWHLRKNTLIEWSQVEKSYPFLNDRKWETPLFI